MVNYIYLISSVIILIVLILSLKTYHNKINKRSRVPFCQFPVKRNLTEKEIGRIQKEFPRTKGLSTDTPVYELNGEYSQFKYSSRGFLIQKYYIKDFDVKLSAAFRKKMEIKNKTQINTEAIITGKGRILIINLNGESV